MTSPQVFSPVSNLDTRSLTGGLGYVRRKSVQTMLADSVGKFNASVMPIYAGEFAVRKRANR